MAQQVGVDAQQVVGLAQAVCDLACAVRRLRRRVEWLEARGLTWDSAQVVCECDRCREAGIMGAGEES